MSEVDDRARVTPRRYRLKQWMYRGGRPGLLARLMNRLSAVQFSAGVLTMGHGVTLEVPGRRTGRLVSFPLVLADYDGGRYLVAMLGNETNWVRNVQAAGGLAVLRYGRTERVRLDLVEPGRRGAILRRYLDVAPGARPHLPVRRGAPLAEFDRIAGQFPVFEVTTVPDEPVR